MKEHKVDKIYIVVCNGISDIGKAWMASSIGRLDPEHTMPIKIDPLLNLVFPQHLGIEINKLCNQHDVDAYVAQENRADSGNFKISEDFQTYKNAGMKIYPECNMIGGDLICRFILSENVNIRKNEIKKRTLNDLSMFMAKEITNIVKHRKPKKLVIEVGGTIEDKEIVYIPGAFRILGTEEYLGVEPEMILLSYFDYAEPHAEGAYRVKTQYIRRGVSKVTEIYQGIKLKACFARRRNVPDAISDDALIMDLKNVAYECQIDPSNVVYLPNVKREEISNILRESNLFL